MVRRRGFSLKALRWTRHERREVGLRALGRLRMLVAEALIMVWAFGEHGVSGSRVRVDRDGRESPGNAPVMGARRGVRS